MWAWYFILIVILIMVAVQIIASRKKTPFSGFKGLIPRFSEETGAEITPYKNKSQVLVEKLTGTPLSFFETTISLYQKGPQQLVAEWAIGKSFENSLAEKYGEEFRHNSQSILRVNHTNTVPEPYYSDIQIELNQGIKEVQVSVPGETINVQVGVILENGTFIPFAQSNDITIPNK